MSTGIPLKNSLKGKKIPIYLSYAGKEAEENIISRNWLNFKSVLSVNDSAEFGNMLFYGDNLSALLFLLHNGYKEKITLIYIDPPFATTSNFVNRKLEHAYSDALCGGAYVEFLRERLILLRELLSDRGSIYLHLDNKMAFTMKIIMDEVFGEDNCRAFITRKKCSTKNYTKNTFGNISDYILFYSKGADYVWNRPYEPWDMEKMLDEYPYIDEHTGKRYKKVPLHAPGVRNGATGKEWRGKLPPKGKHWQYPPETLDALDAAGEIYWSANGNPRRKVFFDPQKGLPIQDIWLNYRDSVNQAQKTTGYPTEKNQAMLRMIINTSSEPGDLVLDCFAGSGTTLGAAFEGGRTWIGVDNSLQSMQAIIKRFTFGLDTYGDYVQGGSNYQQLPLDLPTRCPFMIWATDELAWEIQGIDLKIRPFAS